MKGYVVSAGYMGYVDGAYELFATEDEYYEYLAAQRDLIIFFSRGLGRCPRPLLCVIMNNCLDQLFLQLLLGQLL